MIILHGSVSVSCTDRWYTASVSLNVCPTHTSAIQEKFSSAVVGLTVKVFGNSALLFCVSHWLLVRLVVNVNTLQSVARRLCWFEKRRVWVKKVVSHVD